MREGSKKDQFSRGGASLTQNLGHLAAAKWHTILKEVDKGIWRNRRLRNRTTFDMKEHDLLLLILPGEDEANCFRRVPSLPRARRCFPFEGAIRQSRKAGEKAR